MINETLMNIDVARALDSMTDRDKNVLLKYYFEHKTIKQIAQEYNLSLERVRQIKIRAENKLRKPLKDYKEDLAQRTFGTYRSRSSFSLEVVYKQSFGKGNVYFSTKSNNYHLKKEHGQYTLFDITEGEYVGDEAKKRTLIKSLYLYCTGKEYE